MDNRTERQKFDDWMDSDKCEFSKSGDWECLFEVWNAAKHDAKPVVEIQYKRHNDGKEVWLIDDPFNSGIDEKFDSKEKAEAFAIRYGYRLE